MRAQQQWDFQTGKRDVGKRDPLLAADYERGFLTHGLFAYSRHPNFFAEQSFWVCIALFTVAASGGAWTVGGFTGAAVLIFNFHFSTNFGEVKWAISTPTAISSIPLPPKSQGISAEKYKAYKAYQACTSRLLPWFPGTMKKAE